MGSCVGKDSRTRAIENKLAKAGKVEQKKMKILLLGAGESGKTTLFKQMKLLFTPDKRFSPQDRKAAREIIYKNVMTDMSVLLDALEKAGMKLSREAQTAVQNLTQGQGFSPDMGPLLQELWKDVGIQKVWENRGALQVQDAFSYFMKNITRITETNWEPDNQDILRARAVTTGVKQARFAISNVGFEMYDVGGQRTERKKWIHYFEGVTTVLFVAAISEYNQVLFEDATMNRQKEALLLFKQQLETDCFRDTPFILFLNKNDLFREKLCKIPFRVDAGENARNTTFPGPHIDPKKKYSYLVENEDEEYEKCYRAALEYVRDLFLAQAPPERNPESIYPHATNSTDSDNIKKIMNTCKDIILKEHLQGGGWVP